MNKNIWMIVFAVLSLVFFHTYANAYWISNTSGKIDLELGGFGYPTPDNDTVQNYLIQFGYHTNEFSIMGLRISYISFNEENESITNISNMVSDSYAMADTMYNFDFVMKFNTAKIGDRMLLTTSLLPGVSMVTRNIIEDGTSIKQESYTAFAAGFEIGLRIYLTEGFSLNAGWDLRYMKLKNYSLQSYLGLPASYTMNDEKNGLVYTSLTPNDVLLDYNFLSVIWSF